VTRTVGDGRRARLCRGDSRGVAASSGTAPPCGRVLLRLSPASCRLGSGGLNELVGAMQPAEHRGAHDLHPIRQAMPVGVGFNGQALRRVGETNQSLAETRKGASHAVPALW